MDMCHTKLLSYRATDHELHVLYIVGYYSRFMRAGVPAGWRWGGGGGEGGEDDPVFCH